MFIRDRTTFTPHPRQRDPGIQAIGSENVGIVDLLMGLAIGLDVGEGRRSAGEASLGEQGPDSTARIVKVERQTT